MPPKKRGEAPPTSSTEPQETAADQPKNYGISIFTDLNQIYVTRSFTEYDLESYLLEIIAQGYADRKPGRTLVYPSHTIKKIDAQILP